MGIIEEVALVAHLGMQLSPVSLKLIAAVVAKLPVTMAAAFSIVECTPPGERRDLASIALML